MADAHNPQVAAMGRLFAILTALSLAPDRTLPAVDLLRVAEYGADSEDDRLDQLRRDVRHLVRLGWQIENVADEGSATRFRLTRVDNRLRVHFTPEERRELMRAADAAGLDTVMADLRTDTEAPSAGPGFTAPTRPGVDGVVFDRLTHAIRHRCRARFVYRERARVVHPQTVLLRRGGWYLQAVEDGDDLVKTFAISRIASVDDDEPGTAVLLDDVPRPQLNPVLWPVDPAIEAVVVTDAEHEAMVVAALGEPTTEQDMDGRRRLTIPVIHRSAFRQRLYALGARVLLEGPDALRAEVRAELVAIAGEATA